MSGVAAELVTTGAVRPLLPEIELALLRTAQEALTNIAKHANASRVILTLSYMEDLVSLDVRDDGVGFDPSAAGTYRPDGGYGLTVMRERVRRVAGTLEVESEAGVGTALCACVPAIVAGGMR
jgi:signal transduction histidine kinase